MKFGNFRSSLRLSAVLPLSMAALAASQVSPAYSAARETVLYSFLPGNDGHYPTANLTADSAGNLYGTATSSGVDGGGIVFELTKGNNGESYSETVLHTFAGRNDGYGPDAGLIRDKKGHLYGTTYSGGSAGSGDVFELAPDGQEKVLYTFTGGSDGEKPVGGLVEDKAGNLYGTTMWGGAYRWGTVFKIAKNRGGGYAKTILHNFGSGSDGVQPEATLIADKAGNLYGTTLVGGGSAKCDSGCGIVFKLAPDGTETVLYTFNGRSDGRYPYAGVIEDEAGNLYGTAYEGGANNDGVVYKITSEGKETVLYSFAGGSDGKNPHAGLFADSEGNLYGTTVYGGASNEGTIFELAPDGTETVLHGFTGGRDGRYPEAGLIEDAAGNLYGTTEFGGAGRCVPVWGRWRCGVVFEIRK